MRMWYHVVTCKHSEVEWRSVLYNLIVDVNQDRLIGIVLRGGSQLLKSPRSDDSIKYRSTTSKIDPSRVHRVSR